jgi:parallel beta-helix repeat protein
MLLLSLNIRLARAPATIIVPDDYPTIQAAINAASDGDTIFVKNGTYYENVIVNKSLSLFGESRDSTIVDGNKSGTVVTITRDGVNFENFTVEDSGALDWDTGIYVECSSNNISNNLVTDNNNGIHLMDGNNSLRGNILTNNTYNLGVWGDSISGFEQDIDTSNMIEGKPVYFLVNQKDIVIPSNAGYVGIANSLNISVMNLDLKKNGEGVLLAFSSGCSIINTTTSNNRLGFHLFCSQENVVSDNVLAGNGVGVYFDLSESNTLSQ